MQRLLSTREAADLSGLTPAYIRQLARAGRLTPAAISAHGRLFHPADVERLAGERAQRVARKDRP